MRTYEFAVLLTKDVDLTDEAKQRNVYSQILKDSKDFHIESIQLMGKRQLAYKIRKQVEGQYMIALVKATALNISAIEKIVKSKPEILRYLLLQKIEKKKRRHHGITKSQ